MTRQTFSPREPLVLLIVTGLVLIGSGIRPFDRVTWWLEVAPVLIGAAILVATFPRFRLSPLLDTYQQRASVPGAVRSGIRIDPQIADKLRALGYLQ